MLRITAASNDNEVLLKLDGCVAGPWVRELEVVWHASERTLRRRRMRMDLSGVCHVDDQGRELIAVMFRAGVRFRATGCDLPELLRELAGTASAQVREN